MSDTASSLIELQRRFSDDAACARYLVALRWPDGFRCPRCAHDHAWIQIDIAAINQGDPVQ